MGVSRLNRLDEMKNGTYIVPEFERFSVEEQRIQLSNEEALMLPSELYLAGRAELLQPHIPRVAIIGTRNPSKAGVARTRRLTRELVKYGICIVSGLAQGIDTIAHKTAIASGGNTMAVVGLPLDQVYPPENASLQEYIGKNHLLISQFSPGCTTRSSFFVERNRTMAILSHTTVIIEARDSSGTLSQAAETIRYGKPLFVLRSATQRDDLEWPQRLIHQGAEILDRSEQVVQKLRL